MTTAATTSQSPISVPSQALGAIEVRPESVITMAEPVAGFADTTQYALIEHTREGGAAAGSVFWLQAVERPFHAFVVTDPWGVHPEYAPEISDADAAAARPDELRGRPRLRDPHRPAQPQRDHDQPARAGGGQRGAAAREAGGGAERPVQHQAPDAPLRGELTPAAWAGGFSPGRGAGRGPRGGEPPQQAAAPLVVEPVLGGVPEAVHRRSRAGHRLVAARAPREPAHQALHVGVADRVAAEGDDVVG